MAVYLIHNRPDLIDECCDLINSEWPRSKTARLRTLNASKDNLPTNLVLIENSIVIGHSKLSPIPNIADACFVESVVIHQTFRGKGFGKLLMKKSEEYAKGIGLYTVYLSTFDQEGFYKRLGYEICDPINMYGSCNFSFCVPSIFTQCLTESQSIERDLSKNAHQITTSSSMSSPPPPPPPPPPLSSSSAQNKHSNNKAQNFYKGQKIFLKKSLY